LIEIRAAAYYVVAMPRTFEVEGMRQVAHLVIIAAATFAIGADGPKSDKELLQGDWEIVSLEQDGERYKDAIGSTLRFANGRMLFIDKDDPSDPSECVMAIFPEEFPKQMDFKVTDADWEDAKPEEQFVRQDVEQGQAIKGDDVEPRENDVVEVLEPGEENVMEILQPGEVNVVEIAAPIAAIAPVALEPDDLMAKVVEKGGRIVLAVVELGGGIVLEVVATGDDIVRDDVEPEEETIVETGDHMRGIYRLEGDTLIICFGEERPTEFKTAKGQECCLFHLRRVK